MWNKVYVEKDLKDLSRVRAILGKIKAPVIEIDSYDDIWGKSKKPYLHKRDSLNVFIARKKGQLIKRAPDAYGQKGDPHYYFIHAYNCIYECQYCYLQGYFNSPDIVLFVNHEEIVQEMDMVLKDNPAQQVWFHAGEFSDSLALSHLTGELEIYHEFCQKNPRAKIELRTKSVNIKELVKLKPLSNFIVSFSLAPEKMSKSVDLKTPSVKARLHAMRELATLGHPLGAHFDPIIYEDNFKDSYKKLLQDMQELNLTQTLLYLSLGVVRFTKEVHREMARNYPESIINSISMIKGFDQKVRYMAPLRHWMMNSVKELALKFGVMDSAIYLCMEEDDL